MNKTIKKIVALSMGATMLAGTAAMALATSLSDYPAPFVKDGAYVGKIVIGEKAAAIDTVGALDIATSLQRAASVAVSGSGSTSASAADGYLFKESEILVLGKNLSTVGRTILDDSDLPELLESGTISNDDNDFDYDVELDFVNSKGVTAADIDGDMQDLKYTVPMAYFSLDEGNGKAYDIVVDFSGDAWDAEDFMDSETVTLFGKAYTFDPNNENDEDVLTLFGSGTSLFVVKGTPQKVMYNEKEYTIEVLGGNTADTAANIRINGEVATVEKGDSKTMPRNGLPFFVKEVFVDDSIAAGADISVQLFVGSDKLELDQAASTVTKNGVELEEVVLTTGGNSSSWRNIDKLTFTITPPDADEEVNFILPGEAYVDPVFGAFKLSFVGEKDLMAGKESLNFARSGDTAYVEFTPRGALKATKLVVKDNNDTQEDLWDAADLGNLTKDKIFLWNYQAADPDAAETHVLQIDSIKDGNATSDEDFKVVISDLSHGGTYTIDGTASPISSKIALYAVAGADKDKVSLSTGSSSLLTVATTVTSIFTESNAKINTTTAFDQYTVTEDIGSEAKTAVADTALVSLTWPVDEYNVGISGFPSVSDDEDDNNYYLTEYGTFVNEDSDENSYVKMYVPSEEVAYDMFLMPVDSSVTISAAATGGAVSLNPISVGMAILDNEATLGGKTPYIVVGGPCANTVAAALLGNKANCAEGFVEGTAVIKLFADKNAMLVAGYSGKDTQGACRVLASYKDYAAKFTGTELKVSTANLASLSVSNVE